jgi:glycosyltransferase involved in cell wall biosynthesis
MIPITIGLITYNRPELLKRAVKSVLSQKYNNFTLLIGNDYEKKKVTFKNLGIKKNSKIKIFNHKKNLGERFNMNFLLKKTKTKWFTWLADDDYLHKDFLLRINNSIKKNKNKKIVACYCNYSRSLLPKKLLKSKEIVLNKSDFLRKFTTKKLKLIGVFGFIKTKVLKRIKGIHATGDSFKVNKKKAHIYPYCDPLVPIMLSRHGEIMYLNDPLYHLNVSNDSISATTDDYNTYKSAEPYVLEQLHISIKKNIKDIHKKEIVLNVFDWFMFNRLNLIKKRKLYINLYLIFFYFFDFYKLVFSIKYRINILLLIKYKFKLINNVLRSFV